MVADVLNRPSVVLAQFSWDRATAKLGTRFIDSEELELADSLFLLARWCRNCKHSCACSKKYVPKAHDDQIQEKAEMVLQQILI